jgi:hypothetical protein
MSAASVPSLEYAALGHETQARLTASPHFASGVNLQAASTSGNAEPTPSAGERADENGVNHAQVVVASEDAPEIAPLLVQLGVNLEAARLGRKHVFDDFLRGRLVSLLAMGLSIRQSAAALGLSHVAVWKELKRNPDLEEQINAARTQAQIEPLLVILRESKRSWRAATWVLKHLQRQMAQRDETPEEQRARMREEYAASREESFKESEEWFRRTDESHERLRKEKEEREMQDRIARTQALYPPRKKKQPKPSDAKAAT